MRRTGITIAFLQLTAAVASPSLSADLLQPPESQNANVGRLTGSSNETTISGRVAVLDGRTLWFPKYSAKVRLADIDSCELPQWSYDPKRYGNSSIPKPVPCGPLAKAWLKRTVGSKRITCKVSFSTEPQAFVGVCTAGGRDLAPEMLRVGWARVASPSPSRPDYLAWQQHAMSARYGMWATYVLDMDEWRRKAVDRTLSRQPIADFNLLADRENEISPPFEDARKRPRRTDR
jgi:endonuclease YncB( thermonuclease family)